MSFINNSSIRSSSYYSYKIFGVAVGVLAITGIALAAIGLTAAHGSYFKGIVQLGTTTNGILLGTSLFVFILDLAWMGMLCRKQKVTSSLHLGATPGTSPDPSSILSTKENPVEKRSNPIPQLPSEINYEIFSYLDPMTLSRCCQVSKEWKKLASDERLWSKLLLEQDWREDNPDYLQAFRSLNALKKTIKPSLLDSLLCIQGIGGSGNHVVFRRKLDRTRFEIFVWRIQKGQLAFRCSRIFNSNITVHGYYGEVVYLGLINGNVLIWDLVINTVVTWEGVHHDYIRYISITHDKIITQGGHQNIYTQDDKNPVKIWSKSRQLLRSIDICAHTIHSDDDKIIYSGEWINPKHKHVNTIHIQDLKTGVEETIFRVIHGNHYFNGEFYLSNGVLLIQKRYSHNDLLEMLPGYTTLPILRYDLKKKKWLPELKVDKGCHLVGAVCGLIIIKNGSNCEIWDYR